MAKYIVAFEVVGKVSAIVEANSQEEAEDMVINRQNAEVFLDQWEPTSEVFVALADDDE